MSRLRYISLASGSEGNVYCLETPEGTLVIDAGLSFTEFTKRCAIAEIDMDSICGLVITHDHGDHTKGLRRFHAKYPDVPICANALTAEVIERTCKVSEDAFAIFENGQSFSLGPFEITPFSVPHDVVDSVGFSIRIGDETYFHATDFGAPLEAIGVRLAEADFATLESNHDLELLMRSDRPYVLKQRIAGTHGHLSNDQAAEFVAKYGSKRLKALFLAHLSRKCNEPHLVEETFDKSCWCQKDKPYVAVLAQEKILACVLKS